MGMMRAWGEGALGGRREVGRGRGEEGSS